MTNWLSMSITNLILFWENVNFKREYQQIQGFWNTKMLYDSRIPGKSDWLWGRLEILKILTSWLSYNM